MNRKQTKQRPSSSDTSARPQRRQPAPSSLHLSDNLPGPDKLPDGSGAQALRQASILQMQSRQGNGYAQTLLAGMVFRQTNTEDSVTDQFDATNMSLTPAAAATLSDEALVSQARQVRETLSNRPPFSLEEVGYRENLAALEWVAHERGLSTAPEAMGDTTYVNGVELSISPAHVRYQLEQVIATGGMKALTELVNELEKQMAREAELANMEDKDLNPMLVQYGWSPTNPEILRIVQSEAARLWLESDHFVRDFEATGKFVMKSLLDESQAVIEQQMAQYGFKGFIEKDFAVHVFHSGEFPDQDAAEALSSAAGELLASKNELDQKIEEKNAWLSSTYMEPPDRLELAEEMAEQEVASWDEGQYETLDDVNRSIVSQDVAEYKEMKREIWELKEEYKTLWLLTEQEFPILAAYRAGQDMDKAALMELMDGSPRTQLMALGPKIAGTLANIVRANKGLREGEYSIWKLDRVVEITKLQMLVTSGSVQERLIRDKIEQVYEDEGWLNKAILAVTAALAILAAIPTGGSSLAAWLVLGAELGGLALDIYLAHETYEDYLYGKAAAGTHFNKALALAQSEPSLFWLAVELVGIGLGGAALVKTFREAVHLRRAAGAFEEGAGDMSEINRLRDELNAFGESNLGRRLGDDVIADATAYSDDLLEMAGAGGRAGPTTFADEMNQWIDEALADVEDIATAGAKPLVDSGARGASAEKSFREILEEVDLTGMAEQERAFLEESWLRYKDKPKRRLHSKEEYIRYVYGKRSGQIAPAQRLPKAGMSIEAQVAIEAGRVAEKAQGILRNTPKNNVSFTVTFSDPIRQMSVRKTVIPDFMPVAQKDAAGNFLSARNASEAALIADSKYTWDAAKNIALDDQIRAMIILARRNDVPFVFLLREGSSGVSAGVRQFADAVGAEIHVVRDVSGIVN